MDVVLVDMRRSSCIEIKNLLIHLFSNRVVHRLRQAVVFSEGELFLDDCDFSGSSASVLVFMGEDSTAMIRNAVLGDKNCELLFVVGDIFCSTIHPPLSSIS